MTDETDDPVQVVRHYLDRMSELDLDGVLAVVDDEVTIEMPFGADGQPLAYQGEAALAFLRRVPRLFTRMHFYDVVVHGLTETGYVVAEFKSDGVTHRGAPYPNRYVAMFQVRDGRVVSLREYFDPGVLTRAFGRPA